ncbi:MAG: 2-oxoacid:acceptor oxidoreductase family protein, partial [Nitrospira sp.]|nr:2-oxoacid:acceptor oxidoreductase family protein [Nitrospira sp.]
SYTMPFYSGIKKNGLVIINSNVELLSDADKEYLANLNVAVYTFDGTALALEVAGTELSSNMAMIGAVSGISKVVTLEALDLAIQERFGKKFVASGGTASLDEAIKKKFAKKEQLLQKNMDTIRKSYQIASAWAESQKVAMAA